MPELTVITPEGVLSPERRFEDLHARLGRSQEPSFEECLAKAEEAEAAGSLTIARCWVSLARGAPRRSSRREGSLEAIEGGGS